PARWARVGRRCWRPAGPGTRERCPWLSVEVFEHFHDTLDALDVGGTLGGEIAFRLRDQTQEIDDARFGHDLDARRIDIPVDHEARFDRARDERILAATAERAGFGNAQLIGDATHAVDLAHVAQYLVARVRAGGFA